MVPYTDKYDKVGKKRLRWIHTRVNYLAEECGFMDKYTPPSFKVHGLCICCVQKLLQTHDKAQIDVSPKTQGLYIRCSGLAWLCRARDKLITTRRMIWNPKWLMNKEMYNGMLHNLVYGDCAKNVIYQIEHFNMNLVNQQPHMQTAAKIAEYVVYTNYKPHLLKDDIFPVPPVGYEYLDMKVAARIEDDDEDEVDGENVDTNQIEKLGYEVCNWKPELNDIVAHSNFVNNGPLENVQNKLNNERMLSLLSIDGSLLNNIDKLIAVADPCDLCMWRKEQNPSQVLVCSGAEELCTFKYEFFAEWPKYLWSELNKTEMLLDCDTLEKYAKFMDIIFSVKYIERAFELKTIIDHTLLSLHPHMSYPVTWYDALLYRYYCSPWVTPKGFHLEEGEVVDEAQQSD